MFFKKEQLTSFESISINVSGMRFRHEYEILPKGDKAEISRYRIMIIDRQDVHKLDSRAVISLDDMISLCSRCDIISWNGFHGAHPKNVRDGEMFTFKAVVNGTEKLSAEGSANFPKHYNEFMRSLDELLRNAEGSTNQ